MQLHINRYIHRTAYPERSDPSIALISSNVTTTVNVSALLSACHLPISVGSNSQAAMINILKLKWHNRFSFSFLDPTPFERSFGLKWCTFEKAALGVCLVRPKLANGHGDSERPAGGSKGALIEVNVPLKCRDAAQTNPPKKANIFISSGAISARTGPKDEIGCPSCHGRREGRCNWTLEARTIT